MNSKKGSALVTVILTLTVLSILSVTIVTVITARMRMTASFQDSAQLLYTAQAGIEQTKLYINQKVNECKAAVDSYMTNYTKNNYKQGDDLNAIADSQTDVALINAFNNYNSGGQHYSVSGSFPEVNASYTATATYNSNNNTITVVSKSTHGSSTKIVTTNFSLFNTSKPYPVTSSSGGDMGSVPPNPLIVSGSSSSDMSVKCRSFNVYGPFNIPGGMTKFANDMPINFYGDLTVGSSLTLNNSNLVVTVYGNMLVNGNLIIEKGSNAVKLNVKNGDLLVKGDIIIEGSKSKIIVENGNLKCNGSTNGGIKYNGDSGYISVDKNLYIPKDPPPSTNGVLVVGGSIIKNNYQVTYTPPVYSFGDVSAFQKPNVIQNVGTINSTTNSQRGYGTLSGNTLTIGSATNPKVFYSNGDIHISLAWPLTEIKIYGILYATGRIILEDNYQPPNKVTICGMLMTGQRMDIDEWNMNVELDNRSNSTILSSLSTNYPDVLKYLGGNNTTTINVNIPNGFRSSTWDE